MTKAVLILALMLFGSLRREKPELAANPDQPATANQRDTSHTSPVVQSVRPENRGTRGAREAEDEAGRERNEGLVAWSTLALAIITAILAIGTGFLARFTYRLWKDSAEAARVQAGKMDESIVESRKMIAAVDTNAKKELRAYLVIRTANLEGPGIDPFSWYLTIENTGHTPANRVTIVRSVREVDMNAGPQAATIEQVTENRGALGPGHSEIIRAPIDDIPWETRKRWGGNGQFKLCLHGTVEYVDAFGDTHITDFNRYAEWDRMGRPTRDVATPTGNDIH